MNNLSFFILINILFFYSEIQGQDYIRTINSLYKLDTSLPSNNEARTGQFVYFPDIPTLSQALPNCTDSDNTNMESGMVEIIIPTTEPTVIGLAPYAWFTYSTANGCNDQSFDFSFQLITQDGQSVDLTTSMPLDYYKVEQGESYNFKTIISSENSECEILRVCPIPILMPSVIELEHFSERRNDPLETFNSQESPDVYFQVTADGSEVSTFRLASYLPDDPNMPLEETFELRIMEDPQGEKPDEYGEISEIQSDEENIQVFKYTHPKLFDTSINEATREIKVEILQPNSEEPIQEVTIKIYRTPVALIHGLGSSGVGAFGNLKSSIELSGKFDSDLIDYIDYATTNNASFSTNRFVVSNGLNDLTEKIQDKGIASGKFDLVAHSMGGVLSRMYLQSFIYREDVRKLITLNTPHFGSQWANYYLDPNSLSQSARDVITYFEPGGLNPSKGAVNDLAVGSSALINLNSPGNINRNIVPTHAIVTNATINIPKPTVDVPLIQYRISEFGLIHLNRIIQDKENDINDFLIDLFNSSLHDLVVSDASQRGGLPESSITRLPSINHSSTSNSIVINRVSELLLENPDSNVFHNGGYNSSESDGITYELNNDINQRINISRNSGPNQYIIINEPSSGSYFGTESFINFDIQGSEEIEEIYLIFEAINNELQVFHSLGNSISLTTFSPDWTGVKKVQVLGVLIDTVVTDTINFGICAGSIQLGNFIPSRSDFLSKDSIESKSIINSNNSISFQAAEKIKLLPPFKVETGAAFKASIDVCETVLDPDPRFSFLRLNYAKKTAKEKIGKFKISPNPITNEFLIEYQSPYEEIYKIEMYDSYGKLVSTLDSGIISKGLNQMYISINNQLTPGLYFISLETKTNKLTQRIVLMN